MAFVFSFKIILENFYIQVYIFVDLILAPSSFIKIKFSPIMEFTILLSLSSGESSFGILEFILDSYLMMHRYGCLLLICQRNGKSQFTHDSMVISSTIIFLVLLSCLFWSIQEIYSWYWITMPYLYNLSSWSWFISLYLNYFTTLDSTTIWAWS